MERSERFDAALKNAERNALGYSEIEKERPTAGLDRSIALGANKKTPPLNNVAFILIFAVLQLWLIDKL